MKKEVLSTRILRHPRESGAPGDQVMPRTPGRRLETVRRLCSRRGDVEYSNTVLKAKVGIESWVGSIRQNR